MERLYWSRLPETGRFLFGREAELEDMDAAWDEGRLNVLTLVAWGGVGKSALVKHWLLNRVEADEFHGAERVYAWSFFSQGTTEKTVTADLFIDSALTAFRDPNPKEGTPWDKGERLARLVGACRCLLVLDGLEPLQYPPGPEEGRIKDQAVRALVQGLARHNAGLCLITTRLRVKELEEFEGRTARRIDLNNLSPRAGTQLLSELGVKGDIEELEQASIDFGGHALALTLLGSYLSDICTGDVRRRNEIGPLQQDIREGGHARRVMSSYEKWFGAGPEIAVLRLLGLFDRPASGTEIQAVREPPVIPHLTDTLQALAPFEWSQVVGKLRRAKLIADPDPYQADTLDTHPLVREHFGQQLREQYPDSWREGHARLYEHLMNTAMRLPANVEQMFPVFAAIIHGCEAGCHRDAFKLYRDRVLRGEAYFSTYKLGAFGNEMAILYHFFEPPWKWPVPALTEPEQAFILRQVGYCQRGLGILSEAVKWTAQAGIAYERLKDQKSCMEVYGQLSHLHLHLGNLDEALQVAEKSVELADVLVDSVQFATNLGPNYLRWVNRARVGDVLHHCGHYAEAKEMFHKAEKILNLDRPDWFLFGHSGFKYCDLLLTIGQVEEARRRASWMLDWARENPTDPSATKLTTGLAYLCLANATVAEHSTSDKIDMAQASNLFSQALNDIRLTERQDSVVRALLDRARFLAMAGRLEQAESDLEIANNISKRGDVRLYQVDYHLVAARVLLAQGHNERAMGHYKVAHGQIEHMGYHRRDDEAAELQTKLLRVESISK